MKYYLKMKKNNMKNITYIFFGIIMVMVIVFGFSGKTDASTLGAGGKTIIYGSGESSGGMVQKGSQQTTIVLNNEGKVIEYYLGNSIRGYGSKVVVSPPQTVAEFKGVINSGKLPGTQVATDSGSKVSSCWNFSWSNGLDFNLGSCVAELFNLVVLRMAAFFLWIAGLLFNFTLSYSLNMGDFLTKVPIVDVGWKIFRDVANLCFIFILLYIAINTILQSKGADTKRLLIRVIIVAILLNFSLFFAKVVIDSSNILALQFYEKMGGAESSGPFAKISFEDASKTKGISQTLLKGLGLEGIYKMGSDTTGAEAQAPTIKNVLAVSMGGALLIMVTAFVLFAACIMFIIRTIVLIFLLVLAPLAFLSMVLPQTEGYWKKWLGMLLNQSFFAPLYMMLMYLVVAIVSGEYGGTALKNGTTEINAANLGTFLTGNGSSVGTLYIFVILIALMMGSLIIAKSLGAVGGDFARNIAGKATFGATGWMGRQTAGRLAKRAADSNLAGYMRNSTGFKAPLRSIAGFVDKGAAGSYDFRSSAIGKAAAGTVGGLGDASGEGGFKKMYDDDKKRDSDEAKRVLIQNKKQALKDALKMSDGPAKIAAVQAALNNFSDSEYKELDAGTLSNPLVVQNSRHSQILAVTDEKHDKLNDAQKNDIKEKRRAELEAALQGRGTRSVEDILEGMDDKEKANLPITLLENPAVFRHLGKGVQDKIADRADLTPTQQKEIAAARGAALVTAAATPSPANDDLIKNIMKGMSAKGLAALHKERGNTLLQIPEVAKYISGTHLKDMAELGTIANPRAIGLAIDALITAGTPVVSKQYMTKPDNRAQWM